MKYVKFLSSILAFLVLVGCNKAEEIIRPDFTDMEPIPRLVDDGETIFMLDILSGDIMASQNFEPDDLIFGIWDLDNGIIGAWVGNETLRFLILDHTLNLIEEVHIDFEKLDLPSSQRIFSTGIFRYEEEELWFYRSQEEGNYWNLVRMNLHQSTTEVIGQEDNRFRIRKWADDGIILATKEINRGIDGIAHYYGIIDSNNGVSHFFLHGWTPISNIMRMEEQVLFFASDYDIVAFNLDNLSSRRIGLPDGESRLATFSYGGNDIVTIHQPSASFKKYTPAWTAQLLSYEAIILESEQTNLQIIPISETVYAILSILNEEPHLQHVILQE